MSKITNDLLRKFSEKKNNLFNRSSPVGSRRSTLSDQSGNKQQSFQSIFENHVIDSFVDIFKNANAELYFIQYMESADKLSLIKFYLHVDSFKASFSALDYNDDNRSLIETDASNIYSQYLSIDGSMTFDLPERLRKQVIDKICPQTGYLNPDCFDDIQAFVLNLLEKRYFKAFLASVYYAKYLLDVYSNGFLNINDILRTHNLLCAFLEYLESLEDQHGKNLFEFVINIRDSEQADNNDPDALVEDAMTIYDKYFSMQATHNLHVGDTIRIEIESKICTENGLPDPNAFEHAYNIAYSELQENYVPGFLNSTPFQKITAHLSSFIEYHVGSKSSHINATVPSSPSSANPRVKQRVHSFDYFSTKSSFGNAGSDDGKDDVTSECSGNSTNVKYKSHGSLAQVDELGRYKPLFNKDICGQEELPGRGRLRSTLDRYLNQSAAKESELADEVAKLIINDIQQMVAAGNSVKRG